MVNNSPITVFTIEELNNLVIEGYSFAQATLVPPRKEWKLHGCYQGSREYRERRSAGMGGILVCVYVDLENPKQAVLRNHSGLHIIGVHMLESGEIIPYIIPNQ